MVDINEEAFMKKDKHKKRDKNKFKIISIILIIISLLFTPIISLTLLSFLLFKGNKKSFFMFNVFNNDLVPSNVYSGISGLR